MYTYSVFHIKGEKQRVAHKKLSFKLKEPKSESLSIETLSPQWNCSGKKKKKIPL